MGDFLYRLRRGSGGRELIRLLSLERKGAPSRRSPDPPQPGPSGTGDGDAAVAPLNNAEVSVLLSVNDTVANRDRRRGRSLSRLQNALVAAAHTSRDAATQLHTTRANPRWVNGGLTDDGESGAVPGPDGVPYRAQPAGRRRFWRPAAQAQPGADGRAFREMFDPNQPLIMERTLLIIEAVFVLVEFAFWYGVFSENVDANAPVFDPVRISDILLAVMVPLSGIVAARVVGSLVHRVVSGYPGIGRREQMGAVISAVVAIFAVIAIFALVHARFDASSQPLGATQLPALAMTLIFVVVLLGDMVARIFLVSEIRAQTDKWLRHLDKLKTRATRANRKHAEAWLDLRNAAQMQLDRCERIVASGARMISDQRSRTGASAPRLATVAGMAIRSAHAKDNDGAAPGPMAVPSVAQLHLYGVSLSLGPLRVVEDAIDTLLRWPPRDQRDLADYLHDVLTQLYRLKSAASQQDRPDTSQATPSQAETPAKGAPAPEHRFQTPPPMPVGPPERHPEDGNGADPADEHGHGDRGDAP